MFEHSFKVKIDFEVSDALAKLSRFGMVKQDKQLYSAVSIQDAQVQLDMQWDNIFNFAQ